jgi:hypothetical protein
MIDNGFHKISKAEYHADPCERPSLSSSIANVIVTRSPAHAWRAHPKGGNQREDESESMRTGSLIDSLILGGDTEIVTVKADDWRTKAAKEARDLAAAAGQLAVLEHKLDGARRIADAIKLGIEAAGIKLDGENQLTAIWPESAGGVDFQARARFDHISADGLTVYDLKTTGDASPNGSRLARHCIDFGYHIQAHAYVRAVETLNPERAGRVRFRNIWAEASILRSGVAPVLVTEMAGTMRELGARRWNQACAAFAVGISTGQWRDYSALKIAIEAPAWALDDGTFAPVGPNDPNLPF